MTQEDLEQHAKAWDYAADNFAEYEIRWSDSSLQAEATAHRRLCRAVAQGYRHQIEVENDDT
jgi:hypothetical protein